MILFPLTMTIGSVAVFCCPGTNPTDIAGIPEGTVIKQIADPEYFGGQWFDIVSPRRRRRTTTTGLRWEVQPEGLLPGESVDNYDALGSFLRPLQIWKAADGAYVYSGHNPVLVDFDRRIMGKSMTWRDDLKRKWPESWLPSEGPGGLLISGNMFPMQYIGPLEVEEESHVSSLWEVKPEVSDHRIAITYAKITPESAEEGDAEELGWEDEEGVDVNGVEEMTAVDRAFHFLEWQGVTEASTWPTWSPGTWYSRTTDPDFEDGSSIEYSYHLKGFTPEEEKELYGRLFPMRRAGIGGVRN